MIDVVGRSDLPVPSVDNVDVGLSYINVLSSLLLLSAMRYVTCDWAHTFSLIQTEESVVGYAMAKGFKRLDCQNCSVACDIFTASLQGELYASRLAFIKFKTCDCAKHGLLACSLT